MNGFEDLLGGLPGWAQALGVAVIGILAGLLGLRRAGQKRARSDSSPRTWSQTTESPGRTGAGATRDLDADEIRRLRPSYAPSLDGDPDPGEVVWTWVPYVENDGRGKDRPVLIIARLDDGAFAACYLSTKEHRGFISVGTGGWDSQGRESFLSPDRVLRVTADGMRREGQALGQAAFTRAVQAVAQRHGFSGER